MRYHLGVLAALFLIIAAPSLASSPPTRLGASVRALAFVVAILALSVGLQAYLWRPGGRKRTAYEEWAARRRDQDTATGWYTDPTGRHRVRYMERAKWTKWVADSDQALTDRGAVGLDFVGASASPIRSHRAVPMLVGFVVGGALDVGLIIPALMFPHTAAFGIISADNTHPIGEVWWEIGLALVVVIVARVLWIVRSDLEVSTESFAVTNTPSHDRTLAFGYSFVPMLAAGAPTAWGTWIQNWLFPFSPLFPFIALAAFVGVALVAAIFAVRVAHIEQRDHATLRSRGLRPALRGAFVATTTT